MDSPTARNFTVIYHRVEKILADFSQGLQLKLEEVENGEKLALVTDSDKFYYYYFGYLMNGKVYNHITTFDRIPHNMKNSKKVLAYNCKESETYYELLENSKVLIDPKDIISSENINFTLEDLRISPNNRLEIRTGEKFLKEQQRNVLLPNRSVEVYNSTGNKVGMLNNVVPYFNQINDGFRLFPFHESFENSYFTIKKLGHNYVGCISDKNSKCKNFYGLKPDFTGYNSNSSLVLHPYYYNLENFGNFLGIGVKLVELVELQERVEILEKRIEELNGRQALTALPGEKGEPGLTGLQGKKGEIGSQGLVGPKGDRGLPGIRGPQGPQGLRGVLVPGPKGDQGNVGSVGSQGLVGPKGDMGNKGEIGALGPQGFNGTQGEKGDRGDTGAQGMTGPQGLVGPKGADGIPGIDGAPGVFGDKGDMGAKGINGAPGKDGTPGMPGTQGLPGPVGPKGDTGPRGEKGDRGPRGVDGAPGVDGPKGEQGTQGSRGFNGTQGEKGDMGTLGPVGPKGVDGVPGTDGAPGVSGEKGQAGTKGDEGAQGPVGPKGDKGDIGPIGHQGNKGDKGIQGRQGFNGTQGEKGDPGLKGDRGEIGLPGAPGITGEKGDKGPVGPKGVDGAPGTKGDIGPKGLDGAMGIKGNMGEKGEIGSKGDKGEPGANGLQGLEGPKGSDGLPGQKGDQGLRGFNGTQGVQGPVGPKGEPGMDGIGAAVANQFLHEIKKAKNETLDAKKAAEVAKNASEKSAKEAQDAKEEVVKLNAEVKNMKDDTEEFADQALRSEQNANTFYSQTKNMFCGIKPTDQVCTAPRGKREAERKKYFNDQQATSGASRSSSWINVFANTVVDAVKGTSQFISSFFKPAIGYDNSQPSKAVTTQDVDINGTLLLLDVFTRKITGQKYISTADQPAFSLEELNCYASYITIEFEEVFKYAVVKSGISFKNLSFNPVPVQSAIFEYINKGQYSKIPKILYSSVKEACPNFKQTDKFLAIFKDRMERTLASNKQPRNDVNTEKITTYNERPRSFMSDVTPPSSFKAIDLKAVNRLR